MLIPITFPTLVLRLVKGSPLTFPEGDGNLTAIQNFCESLQTLLLDIVGTSLNQDGTLAPNSVGTQALQNAAVQLANINPSALYSIVPVDTDIGTSTNAYAITARGGLGGSNIVPGGAVYDGNGNYTLNELTLNFGYFWTQGANDFSCQSNPILSASGSFTAAQGSIILTGRPNSNVTATMVQVAPINAYKNGQMFFVYTINSNTGSATLNVNNLGAIPIKLNGSNINTGVIQAPSVFAVVYENGVFVLFSGSGSGTGISNGNSSTTVITTTGVSGQQVFLTPATALQTSGYPFTYTFAHGLGSVPTGFVPTLLCGTTDSGFTAGKYVSLGEFTNGSGSPAFVWSFDASNIYITQLANPNVINPSTGSSVAITIANWSLTAQASLTTDYAGTSVFPALSYEVANPEGAFTFGSSLFLFSQSQFSNNSKFYINIYNLLNNEVTPLVQAASSSGYANVNGSVFGVSFQFAGTANPQFAFCCTGGVYYLSAVNPGTNYVPGGAAYSGSGTVTVPGVGSIPNGTYIWTPGPNDISLVVGATTYLAANAVNGQVIITQGSTWTGTLNGAAGTVVTGTIVGTSTGWTPNIFSTHLKNGGYKPAWYGTPSSTQTVYCVSSDHQFKISSLNCFAVTSTAATLNTFTVGGSSNATPLDLTDAAANGIVNVATFNNWYPAASSAPMLLFQYNPILKRIYVITAELAMVHIFNLTAGSNDFSAWWATASPTREQQLAYVKSIGISGAEGTVITNWPQCHYTVEYDQTTGKEVAIVYTRDGNGTQPGNVHRIPWVE